MKSNLIVYGLLIFYFIMTTFLLNVGQFNYFNEIINPFLWILMASFSILLFRNSSLRVRGESSKLQSLLIVLILYVIIYFLSGLIFGFEVTPYAKDLLGILKNLWSFVLVAVMQEVVRYELLKTNYKKKLNFILITILFFVINLNFNSFLSNFIGIEKGFTYVFSVIIPGILESLILTYLAYKVGLKGSIIYRLFMTALPFVVPIVPHLNWFLRSFIGIMLPLITYVYINYVDTLKTERLSRREMKSYGLKSYIPIFLIVSVLVAFVMGGFKYQPIAIMSGSMVPTFSRGDAVILKKLSTEEKKNLKKGDIICFVSGSKFVVHRINKVINNNGNIEFETKGDHNNAPDFDKVSLEDIKGTVSFYVPYIGFPSVWLSDSVS